jgi:endo-1,4-beta-D-glucanase Y
LDQVWDWTRAELLQPDGTLAWLYGARDGDAPAILDAGAAADADQDTALALLLASRRWQEPVYADEARTLLAGLWEQQTTTVAGRRVLVAGDWARGDAERLPVVNPSYFAPYAYRIFAEADPERPWMELVDSSYAVLSRIAANERLGGERGLVPTWVALDPETGAVALATELADADSFGYDSLRTPWRITLDWLWYRDERARTAMRGFSFLRETLEREGQLAAVYGVDGTPRAEHEAIAMYAGVVPALFFGGGERIAFQVFEQKLAAAYVDDGEVAYWGDPDNYYDQNWAWFATALIDGSMGNLWAGDTRLDWSGIIAE